MMGGMWPANSVCALFACTANWPRLPYTLACSISLCGGVILGTAKTEEITSLPQQRALAEGPPSAMAHNHVRAAQAAELPLRGTRANSHPHPLLPKALADS